MRTKNRILLFTFFCIFLVKANSQPWESKNGYEISTKTSTTPLRVLIVFVEFDYDGNNHCFPVNDNCWNHNQTPPDPDALPFDPDDYFDDQASTTPTAYFSKYFYEASFGQFQVIGDCLKKTIHLPCSLVSNIYLSDYQALSDAITTEFNAHGTRYNHSLSDFDNYDFSNSPYRFGLPKPTGPNNGIDFLIICYGNSYLNNQCSAGSACLDFVSPFTIGGYSVDVGCDFYMCGGPVHKDFILEEFFHALFGANNFHSGTGSANHTFPFRPNNWGMTTQLAGAGMSNMVCAWDRWFLGWESDADDKYIEASDGTNMVETNIDIINNPNPSANGEYILRDFGATGDAIQIKLPHLNWQTNLPKNQYLWIENHQQQTTFDHNSKFMWHQSLCNPFTLCGTDWTKGLYCYIQVGKDIKSSTISESEIWASQSNHSSPNGLASWLFPLTAQGNFDQAYGIPQLYSSWCSRSCISNDVVNDVANPFSGFSLIYGKPNTNNDDEINYKGSFPDYDQGSSIYYSGTGGPITDELSFGGSDKVAFRCSTACPIGGKKILSLSTNPSPFTVLTHMANDNYSSPNTTPLLEYENRTIWLSGLSVSILDELPNGDVRIKVRWDDYDVENDVRWCADMINLSPNDFNINDYSLNIINGSNVLIDRGLSPTYLKARGQINGNYIFSEVTHFISLPDSKIKIDNNSSITVDNGSILEMKSGSIMDINSGAKLIVKRGSKLILNPGSTINVNNGARIIIEDDASVDYLRNPVINLNGSNAVFEINGMLNIKRDPDPLITTDPVFTITTSTTGQNRGYLLFGNSSLFPSANITADNNCSIILSGNSQSNKVLQINQETFYTPANLATFSITLAKVELNSGSRIQASGLNTNINFNMVKFTSTTPGINNGHRGYHHYGQPNTTINNCIFEYGQYGIYANLTYGGSPLNIFYSIFRNCNQGLYAQDKGIGLDNCFFFSNNSAITGSQMSFPSICNGCTVDYNTFGLSWQGYSSANFTLDNPHLNHNSIGARIQSAPLYTNCGTVSFNNTGFDIRIGGTLLMDELINSTSGSDVTAVQNNYTIRTALANYLFLKKGFNNLSPTGIYNQSTINGSFLVGILQPLPFPIVADANQWNVNGTFSQNDYSIVDQYGSPLTITDAHPLNSTVACGQAIPPCPNPPCDNWLDMLSSCPQCDIINTDDFVNERLNEATSISLDMIKSNDPLNYRKGVELFYQILWENYPNPSERELLLLNYNYIKLLESLGNAFKYNQISCNENSVDLCSVLRMVVDIEDKFIVQAETEGNYFRRFYYSMDKAQTYRLACRRDLSLSLLNEIHTWVNQEEIEQVNDFICVVQNEIDILNGTIELGSIEEVMSSCQSNPLLRLAAVKGQNNVLNKTDEEMTVAFFPNVSNRIGFLSSNVENGFYELYNLQGQKIVEQQFNYESDLDLSDLASGTYLIRVINNSSQKFLTKKIIVP